ncbi:hypothetical protein AHAS_Ahas04G0269500 [Arachis hypogaea]
MGEKMKQEQKSIHDILPVELIHIILLRVPAKHLASLRCVSKLWYSLISDPHFAELHFHHSPASSNALIFIQKGSVACLVYLDALFSDDNDASSQVKEVCLPLKKEPPSHLAVLGSCRGFVLLHGHPEFLVLWNPLTGSSRRISYSDIDSRSEYNGFRLPYSPQLYGFGYDASRDDYLVVVAWSQWERQDHFDCLSLRTNSWIYLDTALPKPLRIFAHQPCGLFLNGAIHWLVFPVKAYSVAIFIFDLKERAFSTIYAPEQLPCSYSYPNLALLGGCLALYYHNDDSYSTDIWVMKEYKVHSSWTLYQIPCLYFRPLCLSNNGDIIGEQFLWDKVEKRRFLIYNVGELLPRVKYSCSVYNISSTMLCIQRVSCHSLVTLRIRITRSRRGRKTAIKFTKNVLNNLMSLKVSITKDSNKERELGANIQVNSSTHGEKNI